MDYEKAYKAVLQTATQWFKDGCADKEKICLECVFPELRENEDERIRVRDFMMKQFFRPISPDLADALADAIIEVEKTVLNKKQKESLHISESCKENADSFTSEDERIIEEIKFAVTQMPSERQDTKNKCLAYLEKQKDASKAIEAVDRIDKYIDEHLANAHDMKDSNPDKKYYRGWDDALGKMAGILQDVYSDEKQKEPKSAVSREEILHQLFQNGSITLSDYLYLTEEQKPAEKQDYSGLTERFSEDCVDFNMHEEKEIKESEKPVPNDLEEAANNYLDGVYGKIPHSDFHIAIFIAGAKWQKEQMMKEAVEGWVSSTKGDHFGCVTSVPTDLGKLYGADKCKLIIVKED